MPVPDPPAVGSWTGVIPNAYNNPLLRMTPYYQGPINFAKAPFMSPVPVHSQPGGNDGWHQDQSGADGSAGQQNVAEGGLVHEDDNDNGVQEALTFEKTKP